MAKPKLLYLTARPPYPLIGGDALRGFHLTTALSSVFDVHLLALDDGTIDAELVRSQMSWPTGPCQHVELHTLTPMRSAVGGVAAFLSGEPIQIGYYRSRAVMRRVQELAPQFDAVASQLVRMAEYAQCLKVPRLLEYSDALSLFYERVMHSRGTLQNIKSLTYRFEQPRILRCELELARHFDVLTFCGETDRRWLADRSPDVEAKSITAPNGVRAVPWQGVAQPAGPHLVFLGNMRTLQNQDAVFWFVDNVLPALARRLPQPTLQIIGQVPPDVRRRLEGQAGVELLGVVDDLASVLHSALAGVCPIRLGAGIQNKVLDYMSHGLPVVSSPLGVAGLAASAKAGHSHLQADDPQQWVDAVAALWDHPALRERLALAGRAVIERDFSWERNLAPVVERLHSLVKR